MTKRGLTHPEHVRLGQVLAGVRDQLAEERTALLGAYPQTGGRSAPAARLRAAIDAIDAARTELENVAHLEHPELAGVADYCPPPERRATVVVPAEPAGNGPGGLRLVRP